MHKDIRSLKLSAYSQHVRLMAATKTHQADILNQYILSTEDAQWFISPSNETGESLHPKISSTPQHGPCYIIIIPKKTKKKKTNSINYINSTNPNSLQGNTHFGHTEELAIHGWTAPLTLDSCIKIYIYTVLYKNLQRMHLCTFKTGWYMS